MKRLLIISLSLLLTACSAEYKPIYLPTPVIIKPKLSPLPKIEPLPKNATASDYVRWSTKTNKILWVELNACRRQLEA